MTHELPVHSTIFYGGLFPLNELSESVMNVRQAHTRRLNFNHYDFSQATGLKLENKKTDKAHIIFNTLLSSAVEYYSRELKI